MSDVIEIPKELEERHATAVAEFRSYLADAEEGKITDTDAEERSARVNAELDTVEKLIGGHKRAIEAEIELRTARELGDDLARQSKTEKRTADKLETSEMVEAEKRSMAEFFSGTGGDDLELRALSGTTAAAGGDTISEGFVNQLYVYLTENAAIRQTRARVIRTAKGNTMKLPRVISKPSAALTAAGGTIGESEPQFGQVELGAYKVSFRTLLEHELDVDTDVPLLPILMDLAGEELANRMGFYAIKGTGVAEPQGIDGVAGTGVTAGSATAIASDELYDLQHSVLPGYRTNGEFLLNDTTLAHIRKMKDGDNNYLWNPDYASGAPGLILGDRYVIDPNVDDMATTNKSVFYGDWSKFYIRDVESLRMERSEHAEWNTDEISYRFIARFDTELMDATGAIKALVQA